MTCILISDIHLSPKPKEQFRFDLAPWLVEQCKKYNATHIFCLGDFCDEKDNHSAIFVHKCLEFIDTITNAGIKFGLLKGNHDYSSEEHPYFSFIEKLSDKVRYYTEPTIDSDFYSKTILWLPFSRTEGVYGLEASDVATVDYVFFHATIAGCKAANGQIMQGLPLSTFNGWKPYIWLGDIHKPQKLSNNVEYVGSPYRTNLGDNFTPRCIVLNDDNSRIDIHFPCVTKETININSIDELSKLDKFKDGDQLKIRLHITQAESHDWENYRKQISQTCDKLHLDKCGIELILTDKRNEVKSITEDVKVKTPEQMFEVYCKRENINGYIKEIGKELL
jgi:DNA repair exonuclease SbcCD nuclease subunit